MPIIIPTSFKQQADGLGAPTAWQSFAAMPLASKQGGYGTLGDGKNLYVGESNSLILDVDTLTWSAGSTIPFDSKVGRGTVVGGNLYTGMGLQDYNTISQVQFFNS